MGGIRGPVGEIVWYVADKVSDVVQQRGDDERDGAPAACAK